jgi:hypothetical protein
MLKLPRDTEEAMSWFEWTSVLKLSQMWQMKRIHDLALRKLPPMIHTTDQWITALKTSTQFKIQELRVIAIGKLANELNALQKVELAIECGIEPWLTTAYMEFVTRRECISEEEEDRLGQSRTSNLFRVRHRQFQATPPYDVQSDIQNTFESEFATVATSDGSPVSYWQPNLRTATDSDAIHRDEKYYCIDIIFQVKLFECLVMWLVTLPHHRWKILYSNFLVICSRRALRYSETCFYFLLLMASCLMVVVMNNLSFWKEYARQTFSCCLKP